MWKINNDSVCLWPMNRCYSLVLYSNLILTSAKCRLFSLTSPAERAANTQDLWLCLLSILSWFEGITWCRFLAGISLLLDFHRLLLKWETPKALCNIKFVQPKGQPILMRNSFLLFFMIKCPFLHEAMRNVEQRWQLFSSEQRTLAIVTPVRIISCD